MFFEYVAQSQNGEVTRGRISASGEAVARDLLGCSGYQSVELTVVAQTSSFSFLQTGMSKVKPGDIILFYRQLALLLESGVDIVTSLQLLQSGSGKGAVSRVLDDVVRDLRNGSQLSAALMKHPQVFAPMYCRTIQVGEQTGNLEVILRNMADYMEKDLNTSKGVKSALMYPMITLIVAVMATLVIVTFVLPSFTKLYAAFGVELPLTTRLLMGITDLAAAYGVYVLGLMVAGGIGLYIYTRTDPGKYAMDGLMLKAPLVGRISQLNELARCGRVLALLFKAGLPMTEVMSQLVAGCGNRVIARALTEVQGEMVKGEGLSGPMSKDPVFLPMFVQMVRVGEETGTLDTTLMAVAQTYETEVDDKTKSLVALIQPAMTVFIGVGVGFITISMISAMYSIYGQALK